MSNYLAHLAARVTNPTSGVQPRLAARFEPLAPVAAPAATTLMTSSYKETSAVLTTSPPNEEFSALVPPSSSPAPPLTDEASALNPPTALAPQTITPAPLSEYQEIELPASPPSALPSPSSLIAATATAGLASPPLSPSASIAPIPVNPTSSTSPTHSANVPFQPETFSLESSPSEPNVPFQPEVFSLEPSPSETLVVKPSFPLEAFSSEIPVPLTSDTSAVKPPFQPQEFHLATPNVKVLAADAASISSKLLSIPTDAPIPRVSPLEAASAANLSEPLKPVSLQPNEVAKTVHEISQTLSLSVTDANLQPTADHSHKSPPPAVAKTGILNIASSDSSIAAAFTASLATPPSQLQPERALGEPALPRRQASAESNLIPGVPTVRSIGSQADSETSTPTLLPVPQPGTATPAAAVLLGESQRSSPLLTPRGPSISAWVTPKAIAAVESVPPESPTVTPSSQVNVSIGRIEVRLKPPPRQPVRSARRAPQPNVTSLSDYLRQGGQR